MLTLIRRIVIIPIAAFLLFNLCFLIVDFENYIRFLEYFFSEDRHISDRTPAVLKILSVLTCLLLITIVTINPTFVNRIKRLRLSHLSFNTIFSSAIILLLLICWVWTPRPSVLYAEDGLFESLTVVFVLITSLILIKCSYLSRHLSLRLTLGVMFLVTLFFAMEEISWGQRMLGWETPQFWSRINYQNETNLHNLFNFIYLYLLYPIAYFLLGWLFVSGRNWAILLSRWGINNKLRHLFPRSECIFFGSFLLLMSFISVIFNADELYEELLAVIGLSYSIRLNNIFRSV